MNKQFPQYLMKINGNPFFMSLDEAIRAYSSGAADVTFGEYVIENEKLEVRDLVTGDQRNISDGADRYEASK